MAFRNIFTQPGNASEGCPRCSSPLSADDINVAADTALCRKCGSAFSLSELLHYGRDFNIVDPPRGVSYQEASGGFIVTATTRSWAALFVVPFAGYCILAFGGPFGALIREAEFSQTQLLFVLPFVICVLGMLVTTLMWSIGVVKVRRDGDDGAVFMGVGPVGWTRRFRWPEIVSVLETDANYIRHSGGQRQRAVAINLAGASGPRQIRFGAMLSEERRRYLIWILRKQITR